LATTAAGKDTGIVNRALRAARLEPSLYEEVEKDASASLQAAVIVVVVALCAGIGAALGGSDEDGGFWGFFIGASISAIVIWLIWSVVTLFIGRYFGGEGSFGEVSRALGFSNVPGVLQVLGFLPLLGFVVAVVVAVWQLIAAVIAVRQTMDFNYGKAFITAVAGWVIVFIGKAIWSFLSWVF
jgi:hypothetical protein